MKAEYSKFTDGAVRGIDRWERRRHAISFVVGQLVLSGFTHDEHDEWLITKVIAEEYDERHP